MSNQQGLSGLNAISKSLEVIGNNIANASTFGFKTSRTEFADVYASAASASRTTVGIGVSVDAVAQQFTQGSINTTSNPMDLAINGAGFFQLSDGDATFYSRNGQFKVDREGFIINNQGMKLLGYGVNAAGDIQSGLALPLQVPTAGVKPKVTSEITLEFNLDSRAGSTMPAAPAPNITFTDPSTYNNATSLAVYDDKGQPVALTYYFQKTGTDTWNAYVTANGAPITGTPAAPTPTFAIQFAANGGTPQFGATSAGPFSATAPVMNIPASTNLAGAATLPISNVSMTLSGITQYGANFGVTNQMQDGFAPGQLVGVTFEPNGMLAARYSNGQTKTAGQLEISIFRNNQGLQPVGGNAWAGSFSSGDPINGIPGDGNLGVLQSGALEDSNVDLTAELVNMMTAQRSYQANAQTIRTQDQVMQTLVSLR